MGRRRHLGAGCSPRWSHRQTPQDRDEPFQLNLQHTNLRRANLRGAYLEEADLYGPRLEGLT
ncbi:pentapeptide repeat-containing protein [Streptomyces bottropensis]|uniref:pentapeptide repeat-containing protein n=1 Tax=Streptomyces bottropensis TaxID=42235 RepID=UPI0036C7DB9B